MAKISESPVAAECTGDELIAVVQSGETRRVAASQLATLYAEPGRKIKLVAGVIRNTGSGWAAINNEDHSPLNITGVSVVNGSIRIDHPVSATKVLSLVVTPDEIFDGRYLVGTSVGLDCSYIDIKEIGKSIGGYVYYKSSGWNLANSDFTDAVFDNGILTLTHEETNHDFCCNACGMKIRACVGGVGTNTMEVVFYDDNNAMITTPTSACKAYVTREKRTRKVDANDVISSTGNFWIFGLFEVE